MSLRLSPRRDLGLYRSLLEIVLVWLLMPREISGHGVVSEQALYIWQRVRGADG
jgi:hypothetical protein